MKLRTSVIACAISLALVTLWQPAAAQSLPSMRAATLAWHVPTHFAGAPAKLPVDSLPAHMPWLKRAFWGEHGAFRLLGLAPDTRYQELELRDVMLNWHQRMGLATWGMMTTQMVLGVLIDAYAADYYQSLTPAHRSLGYATFGLYLGTASLALTTPPGRFYDTGASGINVHRWLAVVHFVGMMLQPWLGRAIADAPDPDAYTTRRRLHRLNGWITYAAFTGAIVSIALPL